MTQSLGAFLWAEGQEESGGNYSALGPSVGGDRAYGKYQVMGANIPSWTKRALGQSLTPDQFLNSPQAQEAVAQSILGGYYSKYGPAGAAAMWFSGQPDPNSGASDGNTSVRNYVANVVSLMGRAPASASSGALGSVSNGVYTTGGTTATDASSSTSTKPAGDALWSINLPVVGQTTILTKGQGRAITGALLLASGVIVGGAGVLILAAYGLKKTGAVDAAASAASVIPGAGGVAGKMASAGRSLGSATPGPSRSEKKAASAKAAQQAKNEERAEAREQRARNSERRRAEKNGELPG